MTARARQRGIEQKPRNVQSSAMFHVLYITSSSPTHDRCTAYSSSLKPDGSRSATISFSGIRQPSPSTALHRLARSYEDSA